MEINVLIEEGLDVKPGYGMAAACPGKTPFD